MSLPINHCVKNTLMLVATGIILSACSGTSKQAVVVEQSVNKPVPRISDTYTTKQKPTQPSSQQPAKAVTNTQQATVKPKANTASTSANTQVKPANNSSTKIIITPIAIGEEFTGTTTQANNFAIQTEPAVAPLGNLPIAHQVVVEQLLQEADTAKTSGDTNVAIIKLQQAQRISPREPKVYAHLAAAYLSEGKATRAEQIARKGLTLSAGKHEYGRFFWRLIAACRRSLGDEAGELAALVQAQQL